MPHVNDMPGHLARRFQQIAVSLFQEKLEAAGSDLTPVQYAALAALEAQPGIDQATLAGLVALDRTTVTGVLDRLERKALIVRQVSRTDRRARVLEVTAEGRTVLDAVTPAVHAAQDAILSGLTPAEGRQLVALLAKAVDALNERSRAPLRTGSADPD